MGEGRRTPSFSASPYPPPPLPCEPVSWGPQGHPSSPSPATYPTPRAPRRALWWCCREGAPLWPPRVLPCPVCRAFWSWGWGRLGVQVGVVGVGVGRVAQPLSHHSPPLPPPPPPPPLRRSSSEKVGLRGTAECAPFFAIKGVGRPLCVRCVICVCACFMSGLASPFNGAGGVRVCVFCFVCFDFVSYVCLLACYPVGLV